jgi:hypothetical protein
MNALITENSQRPLSGTNISVSVTQQRLSEGQATCPLQCIQNAQARTGMTAVLGTDDSRIATKPSSTCSYSHCQFV